MQLRRVSHQSRSTWESQTQVLVHSTYLRCCGLVLHATLVGTCICGRTISWRGACKHVNVCKGNCALCRLRPTFWRTLRHLGSTRTAAPFVVEPPAGSACHNLWLCKHKAASPGYSQQHGMGTSSGALACLQSHPAALVSCTQFCAASALCHGGCHQLWHHSALAIWHIASNHSKYRLPGHSASLPPKTTPHGSLKGTLINALTPSITEWLLSASINVWMMQSLVSLYCRDCSWGKNSRALA